MAKAAPGSFFHQAAKASWAAPLVAIVANFVMRNADPGSGRAIWGLALIGIYGLGLVLGVVALFGVPKHGRKGILVPAAIGIALNALILLLSLSMALA